MYEFCTYFDHRFLDRGLALHASLSRHCPTFRLWVLCLDPACHEQLMARQLPGVVPLRLDHLEREDAELASVKPTRSTVEYYFTLTPHLPLHIFSRAPDVDLLTYVDADLFFYSDPAPLFRELGTGAVSIVPHRFASGLKGYERNGLYNVGWLSFRRDPRAHECLLWWRDRCREWCYDRHEDGKYADQKYLDQWPERFRGVVTLGHKGADLAPWNVANYRIRCSTGTVSVDEQPLVFYHFHGLRHIRRNLYDTNLASYHVRPGPELLRGIYDPYIQTLRQLSPPGSGGSLRRQGSGPKARVRHVVRCLKQSLGIALGRYYAYEERA